MIRFINCVRRRQDVSVEDFRHYWKSPEFNALYDRLVAILEPHRCARNLTLQVSANELVREERGSGEPDDRADDAEGEVFSLWGRTHRAALLRRG